MAVFETNGIRVEFNDNVDGVLEALEIAKKRGLMLIGEKAVEYAEEKCPVDTGRLKMNINYEVEGDDAYIGVNHMEPEPYGIYVEFGTGIYAEEGGRQTPWVYKDDKGEWHQTNGMVPQPFIRPSASDHKDEYMEILRDSLKNA